MTWMRPPVDATTQWLRLAGSLVGSVATSLPASLSARRPQRRSVMWSARLLTALGVRVDVHMPAVAWPRPGTGRLVVVNRLSWIDELALATVVRDVRVAGAAGEVTDLLRQGATVLVQPETMTSGPGLGRFRPALLKPAAETGAPLCPVAIRYRTESGAPPVALPGGSARDCLTHTAATRGLVIEVHLLPALPPAGADPRTLAALSEYAVGSVLAADPPRRAGQRATRARQRRRAVSRTSACRVDNSSGIRGRRPEAGWKGMRGGWR
jgi:1-acyl-sn-glycerol-3-phosphate acyltransferase